MSVVWAWCGAPSPTGFRVVAKVTGSSARLFVSKSPDLTNPQVYGPATPGAASTVSLAASALTPATQYYWAVEDDGALDTAWQGKAHTHGAVGSPYSFTFAASGDAGLAGSDAGGNDFITSAVSNRPVFDTIAAHNPLFFIHLGDLHYRNIISGAAADYRQAFEDTLTYNGVEGSNASQGALYRNVPTVYIWDDHDFSDNDSDGTYTGKAAAAQAYRECVPSYNLADQDGIFHSWQVGRVLFIAWDARYYRSPNADADGPAKTMLGATQRSWLEQVLTASDAQALVVLSPVQWMSGFSDSWGGFANERGELANLFTDLGWADRMCMLQADKHSLGIDTGVSNSWGGFPNFLFAGLDASPSNDIGPYDLGITAGRDQYGLVSVVDDGHQITITGTGYRNGSVLRSHSFTIAADTPPSQTPDPTPVGVAVARTSVTWLGCDLVTGEIIAELPEITGQVSRVLGAYTSSSLTLPVPLTGPGAIGDKAFQATVPGRTMIVAVVNDLPTWAGLVLTRKGGTEATLDLGCVSLEGYLDRRYVQAHEWVRQDVASVIAAGLVGDANIEGIGFVVDAPAIGVVKDRGYHATDDLTVYSQLQELMADDDGPEWTVDLDWTDDTHTAIKKIFRVRPRIGQVAEKPDAVFTATATSVFTSIGASQARYSYSEDYTDGRGANHVIATTTGEGDDRPQSAPATHLDPGWPRYERRFTPSTTITHVGTLGGHAEVELERRRLGANTWEISARWDAFPKLNLDWRLGDDVAWELVGHRHPAGVTGQGRVIGWELNTATGLVTPLLLAPFETLQEPEEDDLVKSGITTGTTDGSGFLTVQHGLDVTPLAVHCTGEAPITGTIPSQYVVDSIGSDSFRVRVISHKGNAYEGEVTFRWSAMLA